MYVIWYFKGRRQDHGPDFRVLLTAIALGLKVDLESGDRINHDQWVWSLGVESGITTTGGLVLFLSYFS